MQAAGKQMREVWYLQRQRFIILFIRLLVSRLALHVYHLLQSTLLEFAICSCGAELLLRSLCRIEVYVHSFRPVDWLFIDAGNLLAHIVILRMVSNLDLDNLAVDDVWSLLFDDWNLARTFISHLYRDIHVNKFACVDVFGLQKPCLDSKNIEMSQRLQVIPIVKFWSRHDRVRWDKKSCDCTLTPAKSVSSGT